MVAPCKRDDAATQKLLVDESKRSAKDSIWNVVAEVYVSKCGKSTNAALRSLVSLKVVPI
jgi:hypothetical protein